MSWFVVACVQMSALPSILLAEVSRGATLSESFRSHAGMGRDDVLLGLLMAAALLAGLWAVSRLLGLRRRRRGYNNPQQLFRSLCKAHHLAWSDRALLARMARHHGLRDPGRLFLEFQRWDEQALGPAFALDFVRLRSLRKQVFEGVAQGGVAKTPTRTVAGVRNAGLGRSVEAMLSDGGTRTEIARARSTGFSQKSGELPPKGGTANLPPEGETRNVASPLLPDLPTPTLDVPPWTATQSVEP